MIPDSDLIVVMEAARFALADAEMFDRIATDMDITDEEMADIRDRLVLSMNDKGSIPAECHSDDRAVEVEFDAIHWFRSATDDEIYKLHAESWKFDYTADEIAIAESTRNEAIRTMFSYIEVRRKIEDMGFGCSIDGEAAMLWLKKNKKGIYDTILEKEE